MNTVYDVIVIGSGPAGISAAIYAARAGLNTIILSNDSASATKAEKIENYYGFAEPISGKKLISDGILQAERLGAHILPEEVVSINYETEFAIKTGNHEYKAQSVVLATGSNRIAPKIKNFTKYEGKGISYCAVCDAFFYRGKDVAVLGCCEYAFHETLNLLPIAKSVVLITNGMQLIAEFPKKVQIITKEISSFEGDGVLKGVRFFDGSFLPVAGVFIALGVAGSNDLAKMLGAQTEGLKIVVDENMATNIPGLYAAGDCTGGMMQIVKAAYEGAKAGTEAVKFIRNNAKI